MNRLDESGLPPAPSLDDPSFTQANRSLVDPLWTGTNAIPPGDASRKLAAWTQRAINRQGNSRAASARVAALTAENASLHSRLATGGAPLQSQSIGYRSSIGAPWLTNVLNEFVRTRQVAISMTPYVEIAVNNASALMHGYSGLTTLLDAANAAVQGNVSKGFSANSGVAAAVNGISNPLNTTDQFSVGGVNAATGTAGAVVFGWRVRLTGSLTNWAYRPIQMSIGQPTVTAGAITQVAPVFSCIIVARRLPVDIFVLSPSNAGGVFSISPGRSSDILGNNDTLAAFNIVKVTNLSDANTFVTFESLNARDLMSRLGPVGCASDAVYDGAGSEIGSGDDVYPGIRDAS